MDITIHPRKLSGKLKIIPSKSQAHRLLICAAFSDRSTKVICHATNQDIEATADCLRALGATIDKTEYGYFVKPITAIPHDAVLNCQESGSTLRFMLPIVGALGVDATFKMQGRLPYRPLSPLWEEMERKGCVLNRPTKTTIRCQGKLQHGKFDIDGGISSQFITGLLFATALLNGESQLNIVGKAESEPYIRMTQQALALFKVNTDNFAVKGSFPFQSPGELEVEGDWSNAAFWLAANALSSEISVSGLDINSTQGDRKVAELLQNTWPDQIDATDIPDLVPILAVVAGCKKDTTFTNIGRLRLKESDRVATISAMLQALGAKTAETEDILSIYPAPYHGCTIDAAGDHRIAMAAAIAATVATGPVTIIGAECVKKSYPSFWDEYSKLGGRYEQYMR